MIAFLEMKLKESDGLKLNVNMSSLLHGRLMELGGDGFAEKMHTQALRPYSQSLSKINGEWIWRVNGLNKYVYEELLCKLIDEKEIELKHNGGHINIFPYKREVITFDSLVERNYFGTAAHKYINLEFFTPTAFKKDGRYLFYPRIENIFYSLINRYDSVSENTSVYTENLLNEITKRTEITGYNLRSTLFCLEGTKIKGYTGKITLRISGGGSLINMINMLCDFAQYSGVGIKTAIGMGAVRKTV